MSTKSSLAFKEFMKKESLHIYLEGMDGEYYLEGDTGGIIKLPKEIAIGFAEVLKNLPEVKDV